MGPRAPPLDPPLDYSFESSKNDRHKSSLTGADQYLLPQGGGGTLGISGGGCAAGTLEPLTYTRVSSAKFCYPILE